MKTKTMQLKLKKWFRVFVLCKTKYVKQIAKEKWQQRTNPENQLKILQKNLDEDDNLSKYIIPLKIN